MGDTMQTSDDQIDPHDAYESQRRRRTLLVVLASTALLLFIGALHLIGVLPPGG
jgi:hypothetical protein